MYQYYSRVILALICTYFLLHVVHGITTTNLISSCNQTPYPKVCHHYLNTKLLSTPEDRKTMIATSSLSSFRDLALKVTAEQAVEARHLIVSAMGSGEDDERVKAAWRDCSDLVNDTVDLLNRTTNNDNNNNNNNLDTHTWLSASLANHQTCENGFTELGISHTFPSKLLTNFSKLISNSLAVHKPLTKTTSFSEQVHGRRRLLGSFPEWVSAADRRLLVSGGAAARADITVALDGSGDHKTISEAVVAAAKFGGKRVVVYVKSGVYQENVQIKRGLKNLMIVGDGQSSTIVRGNRNNQAGSTTFRSATFGVSGDGFIAQDVTFENTAGPENHQAVALRSSSDHSVFYRCGFKGYQDTLYAHSNRQFYRDCHVSGTIDFIFGDAAAIFQNCDIVIRKPSSGQKNSVTAQARSDPNENTGFVIHGSRISAGSDLRPVQGSVESYLGRPWQKYSRTVVMKTAIDGSINPRGWLPWSGGFALSTLYYAEYMNSGDGASTARRVTWPGFRVLTSAAEAGKFTVGNFLAGASWIPADIPFSNGL